MADCVVTVPKHLWQVWIEEGDLPGEPWSGYESHFWVRQPPAQWHIGMRVYIVAHGKLRGYAPIIWSELECALNPSRSCLLRGGGAVAVTIAQTIPGFRGYRYRWWDRRTEVLFPEWRTP